MTCLPFYMVTNDIFYVLVFVGYYRRNKNDTLLSFSFSIEPPWSLLLFLHYSEHFYSGWTFPGLLTDKGGKSPPQNLLHILQLWNLTQLSLTKRTSEKYINHVTYLLSSLDICIFPPEISNLVISRNADTDWITF